jgi:hypothetical protein
LRAVIGVGIEDQLGVRDVLLQDERIHRVDDHIGTAVHHQRRLMDGLQIGVGIVAWRAPLGERLDLRRRAFLADLRFAILGAQAEAFEILASGGLAPF